MDKLADKKSRKLLYKALDKHRKHMKNICTTEYERKLINNNSEIIYLMLELFKIDYHLIRDIIKLEKALKKHKNIMFNMAHTPYQKRIITTNNEIIDLLYSRFLSTAYVIS
jgi:hypothetical protein